MRTERLPWFDETGRVLRDAGWAIYAIVAEMGDGEFVVKIGVSSVVYDRYATLICGIPFKSVMLWGYVGDRRKAMALERALHKEFQSRNTAREWFRFSLSDQREFHATIKAHFRRTTGHRLDWNKITEAQLTQWMNECNKKSERRRMERLKPPVRPKRKQQITDLMAKIENEA